MCGGVYMYVFFISSVLEPVLLLTSLVICKNSVFLCMYVCVYAHV